MKRNWRQRWNPEAELVFCRRMRVGDNPKKPFCLPGDKVTKKIRAKVGLNRLRRWFETGVVELANWTAPEPQREKALREKAQREAELAAALAHDSEALRAALEPELPKADTELNELEN